MSQKSRLEALEQVGLVHPRAGDVTSELFCSGDGFFLAADKVQAKYEMLRSRRGRCNCRGSGRVSWLLVCLA